MSFSFSVDQIHAVANTVRGLSIDAIEKAKSGHPGLPLGMAEIGAVLFCSTLKYVADNPHWINRDRFILSAGHGSMLLYSLLYLGGYGLTMEDIKGFRQVGSRTPGHPEYGCTAGVEATTGPLGQGISNAVGIAVAEAHLGEIFKDEDGPLIDHYIYALASDGDLMEGVSAEACSIAGHLQLGKLIVLYDDNGITIEGKTDLAFTENVEQRFSAYGWQTLSVDAYDIPAIQRTITQAQSDTKRPTLICCKSTIGKYAPTKAGTAGVHGSPLGTEEAESTKKILEIDKEFEVDKEIIQWFAELNKSQYANYDNWHRRYQSYTQDSANKERWDCYFNESWKKQIDVWDIPLANHPVATRKSNSVALQAIAQHIPPLIGGSADLAPSNLTTLTEFGDFSAHNRAGRTLHFGVREHAMGAIANGIALHGGLQPFCATFLVFSDYMRGAIRLAALMKIPVIFIFSHDSIYVGEDGPTHQPVEHLASLRTLPNVELWRPADGMECIAAWRQILKHRSGPSILILSRQSLPLLTAVVDNDSNRTNAASQNSAHSIDCTDGAYTVSRERDELTLVVIASGSEVSLAVDAVSASNHAAVIRVVSMVCKDRFETLPQHRRQNIIPDGIKCIVVEAGVSVGWEQYVSHQEDFIGVNDFGYSGKSTEVAAKCGLTKEHIVSRIQFNIQHTV